MLEDQKKKNPRIAPQRLPRTGKKMQTKDNEGEQSKQNFLQYHRLVNYVYTLEQLALLQSLQSLSGVQDGSRRGIYPWFPHATFGVNITRAPTEEAPEKLRNSAGKTSKRVNMPRSAASQNLRKKKSFCEARLAILLEQLVRQHSTSIPPKSTRHSFKIAFLISPPTAEPT